MLSCRPLIVLAGGFDQDQGGMGGFQEWNQVYMFVGCSVVCKYGCCNEFTNNAAGTEG